MGGYQLEILLDRRLPVLHSQIGEAQEHASRLLQMVVIIVVIAGCDGVSTDDADLPDWATSLFADVESLTRVESEEPSVVFQFRGNATVWQT